MGMTASGCSGNRRPDAFLHGRKRDEPIYRQVSGRYGANCQHSPPEPTSEGTFWGTMSQSGTLRLTPLPTDRGRRARRRGGREASRRHSVPVLPACAFPSAPPRCRSWAMVLTPSLRLPLRLQERVPVLVVACEELHPRQQLLLALSVGDGLVGAEATVLLVGDVVRV